MVIFIILLIALFVYFVIDSKKVPAVKPPPVPKITIKYSTLIKHILSVGGNIEITHISENLITIRQNVDDFRKVDYVINNANKKLQVQYIFTMSRIEEPTILNWDFPENFDQKLIIASIQATIHKTKKEAIKNVNPFSVFENLTANQKYTIITVLSIFNNITANLTAKQSRKNLISKYSKELNLLEKNVENYMKSVSAEKLARELLNIDEMQETLLMAFAYDILFCSGNPTEEECIVMENLYNEIIGIDREKFGKSIKRLATDVPEEIIEPANSITNVSNKDRFHLNMINLYESLIESAIHECETEFLIPLAIQEAIISGKKVAEKECSKLANEFKLTTDEIKLIINKSGREIYNKYLEANPNLDKIFNT